MPGVQTCDVPVAGQSVGAAATVKLPVASTPIDDLLGFLGGPTGPPRPAPSSVDRIGSAGGSVGRFLREAAGALVGAS